MLNETEETIDFFVTFLSLVSFQLGPILSPQIRVNRNSSRLSVHSTADRFQKYQLAVT